MIPQPVFTAIKTASLCLLAWAAACRVPWKKEVKTEENYSLISFSLCVCVFPSVCVSSCLQKHGPVLS